MSDLAFVCVSADLDLAEALADVFETAGHSVGDDAEQARAVIVIVSREARRSGAFLEAAQYATGAEKAIVVTRLPLTAARIEGATVFDFSDWDGGVDAPELDALFSAVDLKLVAAHFSERASPINENARVPRADVTPPRVYANPGAWKPGATRRGAIFAIAALALVGALGASLAFGRYGAAEAQLTTARADDLHVAFAASVLNDASFDDIAPPAPEPFGVRGREPPSAASLR